MFNLHDVIEGSKIKYDGSIYDVKGKVLYVTEKESESVYAKMLLNDHNVLVISPEDNVAYIGKNLGKLNEFNGYPTAVSFNGQQYELVNHDYQIVYSILFGNPLDVEGEVEFWDYESGDSIISVAVTSRDKKRADVVAKYISMEELELV